MAKLATFEAEILKGSEVETRGLQMVAARLRMVLAFGEPDALDRLEAIARRYPVSALRILAVMQAREAGSADWMDPWMSQPYASDPFANRKVELDRRQERERERRPGGRSPSRSPDADV